MHRHFNQLTNAQMERLDILAEEACEVGVAIGKIKRHGYESYNPFNPGTNNKEDLRDEMEQLLGAYYRLVHLGEALPIDILRAKNTWNDKLKWTHHQHD